MSKDRFLIPNSGGVYIEKVKDFKDYRNELILFYTHFPYPDNYTLNFFLTNEIRKDPNYNPLSFINFINIKNRGVIPPVPSNLGSTGGTIPNPRGGKVLKVPFFDELKTLWNKYHHKITFSDFELNEFLSKLLKNIPKLNLTKYLNARSLMWKNFKHRFPNAKRRDFNDQFINGDFNIYYKDTPINVFGGDVNVDKLNDRVKESLGISTSFPISLQSTLEKKRYQYPVPIMIKNHLQSLMNLKSVCPQINLSWQNLKIFSKKQQLLSNQ